jgi:competence CoiA-like predicted nuclease
MKFALYGGKKVEAETTLKGALCPVCDAEVIAKCGDKNIHHWAHKSNKECPHWWENETKWHRDWKNQFPEDWQEVIHISETGEKHIADIKTPNGLVVEFQHSYIKPEEILARNNFYKNIIWIVDGKRRPTDEKKFEEALEWRGWDSSRLLKDWTIFPKPVFFDFGKPLLWGGVRWVSY